MRPRRFGLRTAALVIASAIALGIVAGIVIHLQQPAGDGGSPDTAVDLQGQAIWKPGERPAPDFQLPDQSGRPVSLASLHGHNVMLAFFSSRCRLACPREVQTLRIALGLLPPEARPALVIVSLDQSHDTPKSARTAVRRWGLASTTDWHWMLGARKQLAPVWAAYRVGAGRTERPAAGKTPVFLIDRNGFERAGLLYPFPPGWAAGDLRLLSREG